MFRTNAIAPLFVVLIVTAVSARAQTQPEAQELLKKVSETYQNLNSYRFEALQVTETRKENLQGKSQERSEEVFILTRVKPDRSKNELRSPLASFTNISDGRTEWTYLPGLKQYTRKVKAAGALAITETLGAKPADLLADMFGDLFGLLSKELASRLNQYEQIATGVKKAKLLREETVVVGDRNIDCYVVEMEVTSSGGPLGDQFLRRTLWIDKTSTLVLRQIILSRMPMIYGGSTETTVTTSFTVAEVNVPLADGLFAFVPPADATLVEKFAPIRPGLSGKAAAEFTLKDPGGREFNLQGLRGRVVLLDFWATWCAPCLVELPYIEKLHREFKDKGLVVLGINDEEPDVARDFMTKKGYTFTTLVDTRREVTERYQVDAIPQVFVIGRDGVIASHHFGLTGEKELRAALEKVGIRSDHAAGKPAPPRESHVIGKVIMMIPAPVGVTVSVLTEGSLSEHAVKRVQPVYPSKPIVAEAPQVQILVVISEEGKVAEATVLNGHPGMRNEALAAARQWVFKPLVKDGVAVKSVAVLTFAYE